MQIKSCGKFNAACTSNSQCATNTCNNGLCNGFLSSSSSTTSAATSIVAAGPSSAPSSTVVAAPGTLPLGADCADTTQCANGAQCFASTSMQIKSCGKFNAACTSDAQCATNTCNNGLCNGFLSSSSSASSTTTSTASPIVAAPGTLPLGADCADTTQCANGAQCFASTSMQIKSCGKFNAACTSDAQCATNTCQNGICSGFLNSASYLANSASATVKPTAGANGTTVATMTASGTTKAASATSSGPVRFTGAASKEKVGAGVAVVAALFAAAL
ncbi:hypothetical protein BDZ85DRAFT_262933 [Elsinoe ampelina]|uniref:Uncharacterized protein n=1 Tax=Elsinoe ampelina TaxID=302913 RepID=A0A6A6GBG5_9PEZI|nr:hypothetical protein BDZ85DRAFT_262933 [Elsinoe ampelina]